MRRFIGGSTAFLALTGTLLVLPVYAAPLPAAAAVPPSIAQVDLGSVDEPAPAAVVATDDEVVAVGADAEAEVGDLVADPAAGGPGDPAEFPVGDVATTGDEVAGVPVLSLSRPETQDFSAVGVTWAHDDAVSGVTVDIRVQAADGTWGEWTSLEQDDVEQTPVASAPSEALRDGTAPYYTGPSTGIQVVVQAADGSTPQDVRTELIDPGTSAADGQLGAPAVQDQAHAATTMPTIYSRAQWGADESIRTWDPSYSSTIKAATVHHTADSNNYSAAAVPGILRSIYAYHTISRGWGDIGYNVLVDKFGRAWEGRYSGSRGISSPVVGAHAGGFNSYTFGISMIGNYDTAATTPAMVSSVAAVIAWKLSLYGVNPNGTTKLTSSGGGTARYAAGTTVTLPTVFGHRDVGSTSCPGAYGYAQLSNIRAQAGALWIDAREPAGSLDSAVGGEQRITVSGWALDPDRLTSALRVHVHVNGRPVEALSASGSRPDVAASYPGAGAGHGYQATITATRGTHTVCTYGMNVGPGEGNTRLGCRTVTVTGPQPEPRGVLEVATVLGAKLYFSGWTLDDDAPATSIPVHVYVDGRGRALTASGTRPDITRALGVTGAHGFAGAVSLGAAGAHQVCWYAIGVGSGGNTQLDCRTVTVGAQANDPVGGFDGAAVSGRALTVAGWAIDPDRAGSPAAVRIVVDGVARRSLTADGTRRDLAAAYPGVGSAHGWTATFDLAAGAHTVCVVAVNAAAGGDTPLGCRDVTVDPRAYDPVGSLDAVSTVGRVVTLSGWAIDPDVPVSPATVLVQVDGRQVAAGVAGAQRPDVASVVTGAGPAHGFGIAVPVGAGSHTVCAVAVNTGSGTTDVLLGCRPVSVAAAAWDPIGALDVATRSADTVTVGGWAFDPDAEVTPVHVYVDGTLTGVLATGRSRPDVVAAVRGAHPLTGYTGAVAVAPGSHRVCVYAINGGDGSTNPLLGCRTVGA